MMEHFLLYRILATQNSISIAPLNRLPNMLEYVLHVTDNIKAFVRNILLVFDS